MSDASRRRSSIDSDRFAAVAKIRREWDRQVVNHLRSGNEGAKKSFLYLLTFLVTLELVHLRDSNRYLPLIESTN